MNQNELISQAARQISHLSMPSLKAQVFAGRLYSFSSLCYPKGLTNIDIKRLSRVGISLPKNEKRVSGLVHIRNNKLEYLDLPFIDKQISINIGFLKENLDNTFIASLILFNELTSFISDYYSELSPNEIKAAVKARRDALASIGNLVLSFEVPVENQYIFDMTTAPTVGKYVISHINYGL